MKKKPKNQQLLSSQNPYFLQKNELDTCLELINEFIKTKYPSITPVRTLLEYHAYEYLLNTCLDTVIKIKSKDNIEIVPETSLTETNLLEKYPLLLKEEILDSFVEEDIVHHIKKVLIIINKNYVDYIMS